MRQMPIEPFESRVHLYAAPMQLDAGYINFFATSEVSLTRFGEAYSVNLAGANPPSLSGFEIYGPQGLQFAPLLGNWTYQTNLPAPYFNPAGGLFDVVGGSAAGEAIRLTFELDFESADSGSYEMSSITSYSRTQVGRFSLSNTPEFDAQNHGAAIEKIGDVVYARGTAGNDRAAIEIDGDQVYVSLADVYEMYNAASISRVEFDLFDGADTLAGSLSGGIPLYVRGGNGNDLITTGPGSDTIYGDAGKDTIYGGGGGDLIKGGASADRLLGESGKDRLFGNGGNDLLDGGSGNDRLYGEGGADRIYGRGGTDELWGGSGNDNLWGGASADIFYGGAGTDVGKDLGELEIYAAMEYAGE